MHARNRVSVRSTWYRKRTLVGQLRLGVCRTQTDVGLLTGVNSLCERTSPARLAQSVERKALNLVVVASSPTVGVPV